MHRRDAIKGLGAITLAASFPAVVRDFASAREAGTKFRPDYFSGSEFAVLEAVVDTLLPRTKTPGGLDTQVPSFIDLVAKECMDEADGNRIKEGLKALSGSGTKGFGDLPGKERSAVLAGIDEQAFRGDAGSLWLRVVKRLALIGHFTSKDGMTKALDYVKVPGDYKGCIPYKKGQKAMAKTFLIY